MKSDEIVMYIVVNSELKMDKGKIAAQVAHSAVKASHRGSVDTADEWTKWFAGSYTKICLKAPAFMLKKLMKLYPKTCIGTYDEGRTQIPSGSLTTVAFIPMAKGKAPKELSQLKLL